MADLGEHLFRFKRGISLLLWDLETESLSPYHSRPWQIAYALYKDDKQIEFHDDYIWWDDLQISSDAARITRFDYNEYKERARPAEEVLDEFEEKLYDKSIFSITQNGIAFDSLQHNTWRRCLGRAPDFSYLDRMFDTMCLSKAYKKGFRKGENESMLQWQFRLQSYIEKGLKTSISAMCKEFDISLNENELHDAAVDIKLMMAIFGKLKFSVEF